MVGPLQEQSVMKSMAERGAIPARPPGQVCAIEQWRPPFLNEEGWVPVGFRVIQGGQLLSRKRRGA